MLGSFKPGTEEVRVVQTSWVHSSVGRPLHLYGKDSHDSWITIAQAVAGNGQLWGSITRDLMAEQAAPFVSVHTVVFEGLLSHR